MEERKIRCSVGITAYNEEANIGRLLQAILDQRLFEVEIAEIIVVASGCTDRTVDIVREMAARDPRIQLHVQERRKARPLPSTFSCITRVRPSASLRAATPCPAKTRSRR